MGLFSINNVRLAGLAACVPKGRASNAESKLLSPEDCQKLIKTTGVETRRVGTPEQCTSDLCFAAADQLLNSLDWNRQEIDVLVFVSQTADFYLPATACMLQNRLGLGKHVMAFDVSLGCSGFTQGLATVGGILSSTGMRKALLLCGDTPSKSVSPEDRSSALLFGDGGAAAAIVSAPGERMTFDVGSDGSGWAAINIPDGGYRNGFTASSLEMEDVGEGIRRNRTNLVLDGIEVFNFSLREVPKTVQALMGHLALAPDGVDAFVFHQANMLMNEMIRKKLKVPPDKVFYSLRDFGNTSSASIPLTMVTQLRERLEAGKTRLLLCGFGVGLSWATTYLETDSIVCPPLVEI